jgi:hypothetical protein
MNNHGNPLFTLRKPDERALLEIWHIGYGPNITYGLCVADPNLYWTDLASRQPLIVRYGFPPGELIDRPGLVPRDALSARLSSTSCSSRSRTFEYRPFPAKRHLSATAHFTVSQPYWAPRVSATSGTLSRQKAGSQSQSGLGVPSISWSS